jgi:phosphoribosylanthranilate isomerase
MPMFVKICGVTDVEAAEIAVESGANALGFVFANSPRQLTIDDAAAIASRVPRDILRVAVFRRPDAELLAQVIDEFEPDLVQADHDSLDLAAEDLTLPVYREGGALPEGGRFLYEGPESGRGEQVDWGSAADVARVGEMILAGGLRPDNVGRAIASVRPFGVDVSSGVESAPGVKSPSLIRSFVAAVRAAEERLVEA